MTLTLMQMQTLHVNKTMPATEAIDSGVLRGEGSHEPLLERLNYNVVITQLYVCITKL